MKTCKPLALKGRRGVQERGFYLRNVSPSFLNSKCPHLITSPKGKRTAHIPLFHQLMHGALENMASAQWLPDGGCVCVYRPPGWRKTQHPKYKVTKKVHKWRADVCVPSLVGHSLESFYGLFKAVAQTKQTFLYFHHDILEDQARGWGTVKCTASPAPTRGCCFTAKPLLLTWEFILQGLLRP